MPTLMNQTIYKVQYNIMRKKYPQKFEKLMQMIDQIEKLYSNIPSFADQIKVTVGYGSNNIKDLPKIAKDIETIGLLIVYKIINDSCLDKSLKSKLFSDFAKSIKKENNALHKLRTISNYLEKNSSVTVKIIFGDLTTQQLKLTSYKQLLDTITVYVKELDKFSQEFSTKIDSTIEQYQKQVQNMFESSKHKIDIDIKFKELLEDTKQNEIAIIHNLFFRHSIYIKKTLKQLDPVECQKQLNELKLANDIPELINKKPYNNGIKVLANCLVDCKTLNDRKIKADNLLKKINEKMEKFIAKQNRERTRSMPPVPKRPLPPIPTSKTQQRPKSYYAPISVPKLDFGDGVDDDTSDLGAIKLPPTK